MAQSKSSTLRHKVNVLCSMPKEQWAALENAHLAIINEADCETVQRVLSLETCTAPGRDMVCPFSGLLFCGMYEEKLVPSGAASCLHYICNRKKRKRTKELCSPQYLRHASGRDIFFAIGGQLVVFTELKQLLEALWRSHFISAQLQGLEDGFQQEQTQRSPSGEIKSIGRDVVVREYSLLEIQFHFADQMWELSRIATLDAMKTAVQGGLSSVKELDGKARCRWRCLLAPVSGGKTRASIENLRTTDLALIATQHNMHLHNVYCNNAR